MGVADLEAGVDGGGCTRRLSECVVVCPGCQERDAGREMGVCGRTFCDGVGDGVGPFEGGWGASMLCAGEEGEGVPAGAGLASRLDMEAGVEVTAR